MLISFLLLFEIGRAVLTCSSSSRLTPYIVSSTLGFAKTKDMCFSADYSKIFVVGEFFDISADFSSGGATGAILELTTSPTIEITAAVGVEDQNSIQASFNWDIQACDIYPGSTDWVFASDNPLFFARIDLSNIAAAQSYYIDTGDHLFNNQLENFYISSTGSIYFATVDATDATTASIFRVSAFGVLSMTRMLLNDGGTIEFVPVGIELVGSDLVISVLRQTGIGLRSLGVVVMDPTTLAHTARFSSVTRNIASTYLSHHSGDIYLADIMDSTNSIFGFAEIDIVANTITYYTQSDYFISGPILRSVDVDASGNIHVLYSGYTEYGVLTKPVGSMVASWRLFTVTSGDVTTSAGNHWDGYHYWIVSMTYEYNGQLAGNANESLLVTTTQRSCDCTGPTLFVDDFTLASTVETLNAGLMTENNSGSTFTVGTYTLVYFVSPDPTVWNDQGTLMTCNGGTVEFTSGCLADILAVAGAADEVIDLAACITYNGVSLNDASNAALLASSAVTLTDLTNANTDATTYSYIQLVAPTLTILVSGLGAAVPSYKMAVSYTVNDGTFTYQEVDTFNLEVTTGGTVTFVASCLADIAEVAGDPDITIDLAACARYNGAVLSGAILASSSIAVLDVTNGNADANAYTYLEVVSQTLEVYVSGLTAAVSSRTLQIDYSITDGSVYTGSDQFTFVVTAPTGTLTFIASCLLDISEPYSFPDKVVDIAACVELNGAALSAGVQATSVITLTDTTNGNANVLTAYSSYMALSAQTLTVDVSALVAVVAQYTISVSYTVTYFGVNTSATDTFTLQITSAPTLDFIASCLADFSEPYADPDVSIDIAACVTFNGAALSAGVQATSVITLTDTTNGNANVLTAYSSYMSMSSQTLVVDLSSLLAVVAQYSILVSYTVTYLSVNYSNTDTFTFEVTIPPGAVTFLAGCPVDVSEVYGDPDLSIDLAACVEFNGAALTAPLQATSAITLTDLTNGNADALVAYSAYLSLSSQTLNVDVDSYWFTVSQRTLQISYSVTNLGATYSNTDTFTFEITAAPGAVTFVGGCLADVLEVYGDPDVAIDIAACTLFNGAALTAPLQATSVITLTDLTNGNADALVAYSSYLSLSSQTLNIDVDSYWFAVSSRNLQVSYQVTQYGVNFSGTDQFLFEITAAPGAVTFVVGCLADISQQYGTADAVIVLSSCVEFNGVALTAPLLATSAITVTDVTNGNTNALGYSYMSLSAQTLTVDISALLVAVTQYTVEISYSVTQYGVTFTNTDQFLLEVTSPPPNALPVITIPPVAATYELGSGAAAYALTATDADLQALTISFSSGNALLNACCSVSSAGGNNYNVDCNCNNIALVNGDNDLVYTVSLVANDGIANSATATFSLTMTSPNKVPEFYNLDTTISVTTGTNPYTLNLQYRDLNVGDTLTFGHVIADATQALTLTSSTSSGDSVSGGYSLGGRNMVFNFADYEGTVSIAITVTDNNSVGGALGAFNEVRTVVVTVKPEASAQNFPPFFKFSLEPIELDLMESYSLNLTFWKDVDETDKHTVVVEYNDNTELPEFIEFDGKEMLVIEPTSFTHAGYYVLRVTVEDDNSNECACGKQKAMLFLVLRVQGILEEIDFMELFGQIPQWEQDPINQPRLIPTSLSSKGLLTITFSHDLLVPLNPYKVISQGAIQLNITTNYDVYEPSLMLRNWTTVKMTSEYLQLQLNFTDPVLISSYIDDPDILTVKVIQSYLFFAPSLKAFAKAGDETQIEMTPQDRLEDSIYLRAAKVVLQITVFAAIMTIAYQTLISGTLQMLWTLLNSLQIIVHLPLIFVQFPLNARKLSSKFLELSQLDIIDQQMVNSWFFTFSNAKTPDRYRACGYQTYNYLENAGNVFWVIAVYPVACVFCLVFLKSSSNKWIHRIKTIITKAIYFEFIVRMWLESFLEVLASTFLNMKRMSFHPNGEAVSSLLSIASFIALILTFPVLYRVLEKRENLSLTSKVRNLFEDLSLKLKGQRLYFFVYITRRITYGAVLIIFSRFTMTQISLSVTSTFVIVVYTIQFMPFKDKLLNLIEIANECFILFFSYMVLSFVMLDHDPTLRYKLGEVYMAVLLSMVCANVFFISYIQIWVPYKKRQWRKNLRIKIMGMRTHLLRKALERPGNDQSRPNVALNTSFQPLLKTRADIPRDEEIDPDRQETNSKADLIETKNFKMNVSKGAGNLSVAMGKRMKNSFSPNVLKIKLDNSSSILMRPEEEQKRNLAVPLRVSPALQNVRQSSQTFINPQMFSVRAKALKDMRQEQQSKREQMRALKAELGMNGN